MNIGKGPSDTIGIIAITQNGVKIAHSLLPHWSDALIYTLPKFATTHTVLFEHPLSEFTGELFLKHRRLVFIMATGIVVRCIAPWIKAKTTDPAIVVVDESGTFAISLLSGHLGGANTLATEVAAAIGATPVITTASDIKGIISVGMLAQKHGLLIHSMDEAREVTAIQVNGQKVAVVNDTQLPIENENEKSQAEAIIHICHTTQQKWRIPAARLLAKNIIVGIGCRKGKSAEDIIAFVHLQLAKALIDPRCLKAFASIDLKADEPGIVACAQEFNIPLKIYSREEVATVEHLFTGSPFVKNTIGVLSVCEPSAYLAGHCSGTFLLNKQAYNGVTLAIFEMNGS